MEIQTRYRVVAVRKSGTRLVIDDDLPLPEAEQLRGRMLSADSFSEILLEPDISDARCETIEGDGTATVSF